MEESSNSANSVTHRVKSFMRRKEKEENLSDYIKKYIKIYLF